jgi:DNA-binding MarR family transcriptional regulator
MQIELDKNKLAAWRSFITAHAELIGRIETRLDKAKVLPLGWYDVLLALVEAPERRLRMSDLAQAVILSRSGLTRLVDKLETAGYLFRQPSPTDRRGAFAVLTDKGLAALREAWPIYAEGIDENFARFISEEEAGLLTEIFNRFTPATKSVV